MNSKYRQLVQGLLASAALSAPYSASAQQQQSYQFDLPAQDLSASLRAVSDRAGLQLFAAADDINHKRGRSLKGLYTAQQAIDILLSGSGLTSRFDGEAVIIKRASDSDAESDRDIDPAIIVTGSRLKGAAPVIPATVLTSEQIELSGRTDIGDIARTLPQSFGGGQNPGIGTTQGTQNENVNVNGASTFNLRGIGPNATLTLLNGNRVSYTGTSAAIDVSAIPVAAVDRIEILADGASAIYGADAVAGVVNIILKPDYDGVTAKARVGASTDGGNAQQQYGVLAGTSWNSGNIMAAYDFLRNSPINAEDRSYGSTANPQTDFLGGMDRHNLLISGHQNLGSRAKFGFDMLFKTGTQRIDNGFLLDRLVNFQGNDIRNEFETFGIAPTLDIELDSNWSVRASGSYGRDRTDGLTRIYAGGVQTRTAFRYYRNENHSFELGLQGSLFELPGGPVRVAIGGGYRSYFFSADTSNLKFEKRRDNLFAYGEANVPLIDRNDASFLRKASVTGAVRFEDYSDSGNIAVPRLGFSLEPLKNVIFGASWGRSFKLPTLSQQYSGFSTVLVGVSGYGSTFPSGSTFIYALGPDANVGPERSENWTLSATITPTKGLSLRAGYFNIDYADRVAPPLSSSAGVLTNPIYASLVTPNPSLAEQAAIITAANGGLQNATAGAYNPSTVVAILDARNKNIARQIYKGFDLSADYNVKLGSSHSLAFNAGGTWLKSKQQLLNGLPFTQLAGTVFRPPEFRARGGVSLEGKAFSLSAFANHSAGVIDNRRATIVDVDGQTSVDLTARFKLGSSFEVGLDALNIFNAKPDVIFTSAVSDTPFDTTNYSPIGRFIAANVSWKW